MQKEKIIAKSAAVRTSENLPAASCKPEGDFGSAFAREGLTNGLTGLGVGVAFCGASIGSGACKS